MIIKLQPDQISPMWDLIKYSILQANKSVFGDAVPLFLNHILEQMLIGKAQVWVSYKETEDKEKEVYMISITCIMHDPIFQIDYLFGHSAYAIKPLTMELITEAHEAYCQFGRMNSCQKIISTSADERVSALYKRVAMSQEMFVYSKSL